MLVISPLATPGEYGGDFNHYSLLRTLEDGYGISTYLEGATLVNPIASIWK